MYSKPYRQAHQHQCRHRPYQLARPFRHASSRRAILHARIRLFILAEALPRDHRQIAADDIVALVADLVRTAIVVGLVDFTAEGPGLQGIQRLGEEASLAGLGEAQLDSLFCFGGVGAVAVVLKAFGWQVLAGVVAGAAAKMARVHRLPIKADLIPIARIGEPVLPAALRPRRLLQPQVKPEVTFLPNFLVYDSLLLPRFLDRSEGHHRQIRTIENEQRRLRAGTVGQVKYS